MSCFPFTHAWSAWRDILSGKSGAILVQESRCGKCNKARRRQTTYMGGDEFYPHGDEFLP